MPFIFRRLDIPDVYLIESELMRDDRGLLMEAYKLSDFTNAGIDVRFVQENRLVSSKYVLRGLHYQMIPNAQGKLVSCVRGRVFDVAVDIRDGSPFYGRWVGTELSEEDSKMVYLPPGFAHGILSLTDISDVLYKCTAEYSPQDDRGIKWNDPDIAIDWPVDEPVVSPKDAMLPTLKDAENNFVYEAGE